MIPFRPTAIRTGEAVFSLSPYQRHSGNYEFVIDPELYDEILHDPEINARLLFPDVMGLGNRLWGIPLRVDQGVKRGWIHLRREVIT